MNKQKIILVGGGGHCKACIDVIDSLDRFEILGILDLPENIGQRVLDYRIIGSDDDIADWASKGTAFLITLGHLGDTRLRRRIAIKIENSGGKMPVVIAPTAHVSRYAKIGQGTIIMHYAVVNAEANIGTCCIINNHALIEHEASVGDHTHISTGARINGNSNIGNDCFLGSGSVMNQGLSVASNITIGSGSLVRKSIAQNGGVYSGNPLRKIRS